jgi:hypothetical protein
MWWWRALVWVIVTVSLVPLQLSFVRQPHREPIDIATLVAPLSFGVYALVDTLAISTRRQ